MTRWIVGLIALSTVFMAMPAAAQLSVSRSPAEAPTLGRTIRGQSTTIFSVSTSGVVTRVSGDSIRLSTSSVRTPTITVSCGFNSLSSLCALRPIRVTITPAGGQGPATITRLRVANLRGATYRSGSPAEGATVSFDLDPLGLFRDATFDLGMDVRLNGAAPGGEHPFDYLVTAQLL
ncbi:hypothetical protein [Brevundimonas sp. GN22]